MDGDKNNRSEAGERPDYRFSLANERTFLAWIRTSLTLAAGGLALHQFGSSLGPPALRMGLVLVLLGCGALVGGSAYARWKAVEQAMRHNADLPPSGMIPLLAMLIPAVALTLAIALFLS